MIREGIVHDVAGAKPSGMERTRGSPGIVAMSLRLEYRPWRHEKPTGLARRHDIEVAERRSLSLKRRQIGFAHDRQLGQNRARIDFHGIDAVQMLRPARRAQRPRNYARQPFE